MSDSQPDKVPTTVQAWGEIVLPEPLETINLSSLKKKDYDFHARGKIGGDAWTELKQVPGEIVNIQLRKIKESHTGAMCVYFARKLTPNTFKVTVHFCGATGKIATGTLRATIHYQ